MSNVVRLNQARSLANDMGEAVSAFLLFCESKNLSHKTVDYYRYRLQSYIRYTGGQMPPLEPAQVTPASIREFLLHEKETASPATANHALCTLKVFFGFLRDEGYIESNPALSVSKQKVRKPVIETYTPEQIESLLDTCRNDFYGIRDRAIILTFLDCGLRVSELCGIELPDVSWSEQTIRVIGKGNKERVVPFGDGVKYALNRYVSRRGELDTQTLFVSHHGEPLDRWRIRELIVKHSADAGITGARPSPHTLRHTCAVSYLRSGGDTFTLQRLLGHSSQEMTRRYCETLSMADVQTKHRLFSPVDTMGLPEKTKSRKRLQ